MFSSFIKPSKLLSIFFAYTFLFYTVLHGNLAKHSLIIKSDGSLHTFGKNSPGQTPFQRVTPTQILASGVSQITAGINHSLILKTDGSLLAFGSNTSGQLGDGTTTDRSTPTQILASGVSQIAAGETHSLILKADGSLHTFGKNNYGQLGDGTTTDRSTPTQILASGVSQIAAGFAHSLILKTDGSLHTFGKNNNGQLGDGTTTDRSTPTQILASGVSRIAAGENHSLIIKSDGSLHAFGWNGKGQLGNGTTNQRNTPTQILTSGVAQIAAGLYHSLILKSDGSLYTFGENIYGQMGDGTTANKNTPTQILSSGVAQITAGRHHSLILKSNGSLHAFGRNNYGQLGDGTFTDRNTPTQILASGVARLSEQPLPQNDFIPIYPLNSSQLTTLVDSSSIVAGNFKIVEELNSSNELELRIRPVYQSNGNWLDAGANQFYRTNSSYPTLSSVLSYISSNNINAVNAPSGDTISITAPTSGSTVTSNNDNLHIYISYQSNGGGYQTPTWAYRIDSGFPAYGSPHGGTQVVGTTNRNDIFNGLSYGQRQVNVALLDQSGNLHNPPITQTISVNYQSTTGGYQTPTGDTIAITSPGNGSVVTPNNDNLSVNITYQSNGGGYQTPTWAYRIDSSFPSTGVSQIAAGGYHSLILKSDGSLHTFGLNNYGQLGDGTNTYKNSPTQIIASGVSQIAAGLEHSLILKSDGSLHTFGLNNYGQLGDGTNTNKNSPTQIIASGVSQIAAGYYNSLILKSDGSLHTFGRNEYGQLGDGTNTSRNTPTQILASGVSQIAAGTNHALILKADGSLHTFGRNHGGQLGDGSTTDRNTPTQILASGVSKFAAGNSHSLILKTDGSLYTFGKNNYGQLGDGTNTNKNSPTQILASGVSQISAGEGHSLILKADGSLHTFGTNEYGQLGDGTTDNRNTPTQILASGVSQIVAGRNHALILKADGSLHTFGRNHGGQLGDGSTNQRNTPTQISLPATPHGGTQVVGTTNRNDIFNGLSYGQRQVNVALLDQSGNLHNPPITQTISVNYQSTTGGYQTPTGDTIAITSPGNGSVVTPNNDNLSVNITYQSNGGGYQTPTWAYRIDSGFPAYGSPHGGTQVIGTTNRNDIFNGLSYGQRQVNVALLDQSGNLHNPPITQTISVNYQSTTGGYQTPTGDTIAITSPGNGSVVTPNNDNLSVNITYQSNGGGYQTPTWAYRIDSGFPAYGSPHGGTQVIGTTNRNDIFNGLSYGQRQVNVALLDQSGNLHNPPITQTISVNYQSTTGGYQTPTGDTIAITSPGNGSVVTPNNDNLSVNITYQSNGGGYQTPTWAYRIDSGFPAYGSPHGGIQVVGTTNRNDIFNGLGYGQKQVNVALLDQSGNLHNPPITQTISVNYQSTTGGYQTQTGDTIHITSPGNGSVVTPSNDNLSVNITYQSNGGGYQTPTWAYRIDSGFPAYGSPHGGIQVVGTTNRNDIFNGLSYGQRQVNVALLDQSGNLHNPPITQTISVNYQSTTGGYQTPTGDTIHITSPGNGSVVTPNNDNLSVNITYQSNAGGYQTPTWAYRIDSGFPAYGSPHGGIQVVGTTNRNDIFNGLSYGQRQVNVALLDQSGNLHNPPITQSISVNYQSTTGGYQTPTGNYQTPTGNTNQPSSPNDQNNNTPIPILSASDGRVLIDQLNGKFRYRDLKNITVWTVSQSQGTWQIRTGFHDNSLGYSTNGALNQYPANLSTGTPYQIDSQGIYIWNPSAGALYYEIESVVNGMVTSDYYFGSTQTTSIGKSYMFINKSLAETFYASKNPNSTPTSNPSPAPTPQPTPALVLLKPIVETVNFSTNQRSITLNGKLVQSGSSNSSSDETLGFLISPIAKLDPLNSTTSKIISVLNGNENFSSVYSPATGNIFYFKAFAENQVGITYGRTLKISLQSESDPNKMNAQEKAVYILKADSIEIAGGWLQNNWFGTFKEFGNGWTYHADHGWLYLSADSENGIWAWSRDRGWVWSRKGIYPFFYQKNIGDWIYFLMKRNGVLYYYNYSDKALEQQRQ